jgi:hypothetical protein
MISLATWPAIAAETIGAIGAEKCGGAQRSYAVSFLAPESADVEARVKAMVGGSDDVRTAATLSLDGKPCLAGRCAFRATKGETYRLAAASAGSRVDNLCISVTRP